MKQNPKDITLVELQISQTAIGNCTFLEMLHRLLNLEL